MSAGSKIGSSTYILTGALAIVLPTSIIVWLVYYMSPFRDTESELSPIRCFMSILIPSAILYNAIKNKKLDKTALLVAFVMGFVETLSNMCMIATTITFFLAGTKATKYQKAAKKFDEEDVKQQDSKTGGTGTRRNWIQVLSNGGVGMEIAILMLIEKGPANELPIQFSKDYFSTCLCLAFLGSISCACGDTLASELAPALSSSVPRLIINPFRRVPKGTNGGVTMTGFVCSGLGGFLCGLTYFLLVQVCVPRNVLVVSPAQWPLIIVGTLSGLLGSIIDSVIGALFQYSGYDPATKLVVNKPRVGVMKISGAEILDNHSVNLLSTLFTALLTPFLAEQVWYKLHLI